VLEVSSPGIERPLTRRSHFERFVGQDVDVRLYEKREGRKKYLGTLESVEDGERGFRITIRDGEERWTFAQDEIARAKLHVKW
jgi:ribosome maturation factor RimP